jgi:hypothetical protein
MKKRVLLATVFFITMGAAFGQSSYLPQMDAAIRGLAGDINRRLNEGGARRVAVTQFTYQNRISPLGSYWANQLVTELTAQSNRSFALLSGDSIDADWTISGEIIEAPDLIRVFTRLIRLGDRTIAASFNSDLQRNEYTSAMLYSDDMWGGSRYVAMDAMEPDSWDNPVSVEPGFDGNVMFMERTLHNENDEDYFLLTPGRDGLLVMETSGSTDTIMYLYNAGTREELAEDDDSGSDLNARITYRVQAGRRYIVRVTGYGETTGTYGFRAFFN